LSSCSDIYFDSPLPKEGVELQYFPIEFIGKYLTEEKDTILFQNSHILTGIADLNIELGENTKLVEFKGDYYLNVKSSEGWQFSKITANPDGLTSYFNTTNEIMEKLSPSIYTKKNSNYVINMTSHTSLNMIEKKGFLNKNIKLKKLRIDSE